MTRGRRFLGAVLIVAVAGCGQAAPGAGGGGGGDNGGSSGGGANGGSNGGGGTTGGGGGTTGGGGGTTGGGGGTTGGGGGTTGGGGGTTGGAPLVPGTYDVTTKYNLLDALPPDVEKALSLILEFADSPGNFLFDVADQIPVVKYVIDAINLFPGVKQQIIDKINDWITSWSGNVVPTMHGIAEQLHMAITGFSMHSKLVIGTPDASGNVTVQDTMVDLSFTWNGKPHPYPQNAHATAMGTLQGLQVKMPGHPYDKGLDFGAILVDLIDNVALPELTGVNSIGALANQLIDCYALADAVWGVIGNVHIGDTYLSKYIGPQDIGRLCVNGLNLAGAVAEAELGSLTAPGKMSAGDFACLAVENHGHTGHADSLTNGTWSLSLPAGAGAISLPGTFTGTVSP